MSPSLRAVVIENSTVALLMYTCLVNYPILKMCIIKKIVIRMIWTRIENFREIKILD
jgi:hypothetical protein